jgi:hypothetical protein
MNLTTRVGLLAGATAMTLTGMGAAATTDTNAEELRAQIEKLNARVAELEGGNWLTEQRSNEIRGLVNDVLADADTRASLLGSGMTAGYNDGFTIGSADGNYSLRLNGQLQFRYNYSYQSDIDDVGGDRHRTGFENTRTKLWFSGHIVNPQWQYVIEGNFDRNGGDFGLLDAYISYDYGNGVSMTAGQFKLPLLREELVDSRYQQTVERSLVNSYYTGGRSQGLMVTWAQDNFRFHGAFSDGAGQANTGWQMRTTEYAFTGRAELLLDGNWDQFSQFRSPTGGEQGFLVGVAAHWEDGEYGTAANEFEIFRLTADISAQFGGWNLFGAYIFENIDSSIGGSVSDHAIVVQGGFHLTDEWELFGRYEHAWFDSAYDASDLSILTIGANYYIAGHNAKLTADFGYAFNEVDFGNTMAGWRGDMGTDDGQIVIRTQLQLLF